MVIYMVVEVLPQQKVIVWGVYSNIKKAEKRLKELVNEHLETCFELERLEVN